LDRATRKQLKSDNFALEVQHGFEFVTGHRQAMVRWAIIAAAVVVVAVAIFLYVQHQSGVRQEALQQAMRTESASVGPPTNEYAAFFPTQAAKDKAAVKAWTDLAAKYDGSEAGIIAQYYLAGHAAEAGNAKEAEKRLKMVVDSGNANYAPMAKLSLAQLYASEGNLPEARKLLQSLIDNPTGLVSKEQAIITLAHVLAPSDPQAARKLLEPLRGSERPAVSRQALTALSELSR
jgi:predicted negative regulator of RcsB-dependent stress response